MKYNLKFMTLMILVISAGFFSACFDAADSKRQPFVPVDPSNIKGIKLKVRNPFGRIKYCNGYIYVSGASQLFAMSDGTIINDFGGVQRVNVATLKAEENVIYQGHRITDVAVVSDTRAYLVEYKDWGNSALRAFNPDSKEVYPGNAAGIGDEGNWNIISLRVDSHDKLWVANTQIYKKEKDTVSGYDSGIYVIKPNDNPSLDSIDGEKINTYLAPQYISFCNDKAVVVTASPNYSVGAHSIVNVVASDGKRNSVNNLVGDVSDLAIDTYGDHFYRIQRYMSDSVMKFHINSPGHVLAHSGDKDSDVIWQYSAMDSKDENEEYLTSTNPHSLVIANQNRAFLLRYESRRAWIVNPSATTNKDFKIGELSLYDYADEDGVPEMTSGVVVGSRLFIAVQRLYRDTDGIWKAKNDSYLAVFDITTGEEIDTR